MIIVLNIKREAKNKNLYSNSILREPEKREIHFSLNYHPQDIQKLFYAH